ncbi:protein charybde isoform X2 [Stomoxys calcitrans]|uniref:Protein scylla n=1 Tax=Stomoxys calcitrans TaxID=35570 RepID=A0A1I8P860_STOCA|nr:protein charybde isoform X2 [Stomoxys calcitrans]
MNWTSSLTPPSPVAATASPTSPSSTTTNTFTNDTFHHHQQYCHSPIEEHFDVVDGIKPQQNHTHFFCSPSVNTAGYSSPFGQQAHSFAMETAAAATPPPKGGIETPSGAHYSYNNNLLYCASDSTPASAVVNRGATPKSYHKRCNSSNGFVGAFPPSPASSNLSTPTEATEHYGIGEHDDIDAAAVNELSERLQSELRAAKSRHLSCTEVSLPWDLTPRIAADMIKTSEREPCGVRGCAIFIDFEDETGNARRIASFKVDPTTVSTFELFLTLKQDKGGWTSLLPQFLKNLTRSSTILISPHFTLNKHKLYACE